MCKSRAQWSLLASRAKLHAVVDIGASWGEAPGFGNDNLLALEMGAPSHRIKHSWDPTLALRQAICVANSETSHSAHPISSHRIRFPPLSGASIITSDLIRCLLDKCTIPADHPRESNHLATHCVTLLCGRRTNRLCSLVRLARLRRKGVSSRPFGCDRSYIQLRRGGFRPH